MHSVLILIYLLTHHFATHPHCFSSSHLGSCSFHMKYVTWISLFCRWKLCFCCSEMFLSYSLFWKIFSLDVKFWVTNYFSFSLLMISFPCLLVQLLSISFLWHRLPYSSNAICLFLRHLLRLSWPLIYCSFTMCLVWICFYLSCLGIYKLLNLWIGIFHHPRKFSVIVSPGISAPFCLFPLLLDHLLHIC